MPVIGTMGALTYDKVPLGTSNNYWMLTAPNCSYITSTFKNNELWLAGFNAYDQTALGNATVFKVVDDFTPIISRQNKVRITSYTSSDLMGFRKIVVNNSNNLTVVGVGYISSNNNGGTITTFDSSATVLTSKFYSGPILIDPVATYQPRLNQCVAYDSAGNYYVAGWTRESVATGYSMFITKFNGSTDAIIWSKYAYQAGSIVNTNPGTVPFFLKVDNSNNIILMYAAPGVGWKIISFSSVGTINYQKKRTDAGDINNFDMDSNNNIYILGSVYDSGTASYIPAVIKYNSSMVLQWTKILTDSGEWGTIGLTREDIPIKIYGDNIYISLDRRTTGGSPSTLGSYLINLDLNGNFVWATNLNYFESSVKKYVRWQSLSINIKGIYATFWPELTGALRYTYNIIKLPIDGSVPGTGNYTVSANTYITYNSESLTFINSASSPTIVSGTLTIADASPIPLTNAPLTSNNSISTFTTISL